MKNVFQNVNKLALKGKKGKIKIEKKWFVSTFGDLFLHMNSAAKLCIITMFYFEWTIVIVVFLKLEL